MTITFDLDAVSSTEFGVSRDTGGTPQFRLVPVDAAVQSALQAMARATQARFDASEDGPSAYVPSEKHGDTEYLITTAGSEFETIFRQLYEAENIPIDSGGLAEPEGISSYFARFIDRAGRRLTALRRASHFKGVLKSRLMQFSGDTLRLVEDKVFKLDTDFDLLVDSDQTHILRPNAFEVLGHLQQSVMAAVPTNVNAVAAELPFVDVAGMTDYAMTHVRAARYLASIRTQALAGMDKALLLALCSHTGVETNEVNNQITPGDGHTLGFLEVLDRRRYQVELVPGNPERYRATSRKKLQ